MHEAMLYGKLKGGAVKCNLCSHRCAIADGKLGFCACRLNEKGALYSLNYGKSTGLSLDPIEKKPFYHFHPGTVALSFGTPGCNFRCKGCLNWFMSQSPRDSREAFGFPSTSPVEIAAASKNADGIAYTYTEPTVFFEYARDTILATKKMFPEKYHVFVSNGFFSEEMWKVVAKEKLLDAIRIDLKSFSDKFYREYCGGRLEPVLESIKRVHAGKAHLELITLVVPGRNDSPEELRALSEWVAKLDENIPLHFIRFFPQYEAGNVAATPEAKLLEAREIAKEAGVKYAYVGNTSGEDNTVCAECGAAVVRRQGLRLAENLLKNGKCPSCGGSIPGVW
ncbi:AmmeMemoRadiSam system radical SAM enzyme [Candidatus Micrarchaeota archaeon CG_4_10_14_0_2_um_filter_60_11]|nr:MAG: AmmeMemoRadiSam system radical SAM enzyme [Candidatus Micrarchaeota archaeon CG1_02_60_51]PIN96635.1 MAG: AmmeMemoRadiSam system radical SAM enzyme [Candidatus Micrarchaeota archaeon CG10_big_fil_rev_8_21_14_0_10_60_32]PIO02436.1 MAG: AmmeMemoRadiSam system radical SAM enzyme [Candidatus Micrarchaeota archaeon CG09_land_8_20_14_0_10_60_16]PIZ90685.1 MAG: AmmeMemoRadiSam system radical SAM enzyme [Candidatus Micrarchaeota archaeon CG_4_10_14_0_2_um_filter_60_11]